MRKKILNFFIFLTLYSILYTLYSFAAMLDKVVVVVNSETITQGELDVAFAPVFEKLKLKFKGEELARELTAVKKEILDRMVDEKVILSEAKKRGIEAPDSEIDGKLREIKAKFDSEKQFNDILRQEGVALNELKQRYADQIKVAKLVEQEIRRKIIVSPSDALQYYNVHKEEFKAPEQVRLKNILIKPDENLKEEEALILAEKILGFLKAGEEFDELALKYSRGPNADMGGDLGFVKRGQMLPQIEDVVFSLDAGQLSEIIKTQLGYHIFKVEEKRPEGIKDLAEVKDEIEKILFVEKAKLRYEEWVKELKKNAYISYR